MAILFDLGVEYPAGVGRKLEAHGGLTDGTLILYDFSVPDCIDPASNDIGTAINLADAKCLALTGASPYMRRRSGQTIGTTERTAGGGFRMLTNPGNSGVSIAGPASTDARPAGFDAYLRQGGVAANQPDLVIMHYFRCEYTAVPYTIAAHSQSSFANSLFRVNITSGGMQINGLTVAPPSGLIQVATSKDAVFMNGRKLAGLDPAAYHAALNLFTAPTNPVRMQVIWDGRPDQPTSTTYRHVIEDLKVSGRTAQQAVAEDLDFVRRFAPYFNVA